MGPLDGIRIVDASSFITGPFAAMMMADMGADVVKVEPTPRGDAYRRFGIQHDGRGIAFMNVNRNKRSIAVDLREPGGRSELEELLDGADVLFTNWRPSTMRALDLGEGLLERHPRLVWLRITGFGLDGPVADVPAFDSVIQARTGLAWMQGYGGRPALVHSWICDKVTAMFASQAALAALWSRASTGEGAIVDLPMLDSVAYFNFPDLMVGRTVVDHTDAPAANLQLMANRPLPTSDGWLLLSPVGGRQLVRSLAVLGREGAKDELLSSSDPAALAGRFYEIAEEVTPERPTEEWLALFAENEVPAAPVFDFDEHLADQQVEHNDTYVTFEVPGYGSIRQPRHPATFPTGRGGPVRPPPLLDEHRDEIVRERRDRRDRRH